MSTSDTIFLFTREPLNQAAGRVAAALHLDRLDDPDLKENEYFLRGQGPHRRGTRPARCRAQHLWRKRSRT
jgi:hypothetical protein